MTDFFEQKNKGQMVYNLIMIDVTKIKTTKEHSYSRFFFQRVTSKIITCCIM